MLDMNTYSMWVCILSKYEINISACMEYEHLESVVFTPGQCVEHMVNGLSIWTRNEYVEYCQKMFHFLHTTILTMCTAKKVNLNLEARAPLRCRLS
jgi:hypothetical protein